MSHCYWPPTIPTSATRETPTARAMYERLLGEELTPIYTAVAANHGDVLGELTRAAS